MLSPVNNDLTGLVFETSKNKIALEDSISKLSSGKRLVNSGEDSGAYSQASKIGSKHKRDLANLQNLQKTKFINKKYRKIKLLGAGDLKQKLDIEVNSISKSAKEKVEKLGGKVTIIK